ncbi:hypothetical protein E3T55_07040 [Cryobacterium frigoriphilum]|uniref:Polysaccharide chain length determinant N-terminal domain-containing protein n=1 Tax=Cryobacterium frigoriphilum TaxID=1259150 RepID=A0A4R9A4K1_9MICO|nr:hypothetical protein [Cryobacterium frigoriphilum]TFD52133.1 hypothetical protein E3T55_07040 [Cryobacterium frigoriphilum]
MNLRDLTHILLRRWLLVLLGLLVTGGACYGLFLTVPVTYVARTSLVMLPPATVVQGGNPFLYLGGLGQALDVLTRKINADEVVKPIEDAFPESEFIAMADSSTSGPILLVEGTGPTAADALAVTEAAVSAAPGALSSLQTSLSVPDPARITLAPLSIDEKPTVNFRSRVQAIGATAAVGLIATLLLAAYRDGRVRVRRIRDDELAAELVHKALQPSGLARSGAAVRGPERAPESVST